MMASYESLPDGFEVEIKPEVWPCDNGRLLVGGSPVRAMHFKHDAAEVISGGRVRVVDRRSRLVARRLLDANMADPVLVGRPIPGAETLTVVIPVRDRPRQLGRALRALRDGSSASAAVVVVDDASLQPEAVAEVAAAHGARYVGLTRNVGPAGARNAGLRTVVTPLVAFVDSDVTVSTATLLALSRHFDDPAVALVAPCVVGKARSAHPRWFERYDEAASSLALGRTACSVRPGAAVAWLPSACVVARVDRVGEGFDSDMRVAEDVDLVWRLAADGHVVRYDPSYEALHDARTTLLGWMGRKFVYGTGGGDLAARHADKCATAVLTPSYAVGAAALLAGRWWSLPLTLLCTQRGVRAVTRALPDVSERSTISRLLAVRGMGWAIRQESTLLLRHWWPATFVACLMSRRVRRAAVAALAVDALVAAVERPTLNPAIVFAGRRLDDLSYGAGLWVGALRRRSLRALAIRSRPLAWQESRPPALAASKLPDLERSTP